jgi:hypothetical protein
MDSIVQDLLIALQPCLRRAGGFVTGRRSRLLYHDSATIGPMPQSCTRCE